MKNKDPRSKVGNKVKSGSRVLAAAGAIMLGACTTGGSSSAEQKPSISAPITTLAPETTTTLSPEALAVKAKEKAEKYVSSPERNQQFDDTISAYGTRIVEAISHGKFGKFDAYNFNTGTYRSQQIDAGWVYLQHSPDYGGSNTLIEAFVYQNEDGTYDLTKGVHGIDVHVDGMDSVSLTSPDFFTLWREGSKAQSGWDVSVSKTNPDGSISFNHSSPNESYTASIDQLEAVDQTALATFGHSMQALGLAG